MDESRLQRLWQQRSADQLLPADSADAFAERAAQRDPAIDALAGHALAADLARTVMALEADAQALAREVAQRRQSAPRVSPRWRQAGGWALAASVALAAVLALPRGQQAEVMPVQPVSDADRIVSSSFESTAGSTPATAPASSPQVFAGGFDS